MSSTESNERIGPLSYSGVSSQDENARFAELRKVLTDDVKLYKPPETRFRPVLRKKFPWSSPAIKVEPDLVEKLEYYSLEDRLAAINSLSKLKTIRALNYLLQLMAHDGPHQNHDDYVTWYEPSSIEFRNVKSKLLRKELCQALLEYKQRTEACCREHHDMGYRYASVDHWGLAEARNRMIEDRNAYIILELATLKLAISLAQTGSDIVVDELIRTARGGELDNTMNYATREVERNWEFDKSGQIIAIEALGETKSRRARDYLCLLEVHEEPSNRDWVNDHFELKFPNAEGELKGRLAYGLKLYASSKEHHDDMLRGLRPDNAYWVLRKAIGELQVSVG